MLPVQILIELYDIKYKASDNVTNYLCDSIEAVGYNIISVDNYDSSIIIKFNNESVIADLRVDRLFKNFELREHDEQSCVFISDWDQVIINLQRLNDAKPSIN